MPRCPPPTLMPFFLSVYMAKVFGLFVIFLLLSMLEEFCPSPFSSLHASAFSFSFIRFFSLFGSSHIFSLFLFLVLFLIFSLQVLMLPHMFFSFVSLFLTPPLVLYYPHFYIATGIFFFCILLHHSLLANFLPSCYKSLLFPGVSPLALPLFLWSLFMGLSPDLYSFPPTVPILYIFYFNDLFFFFILAL